MVLEVFSRPYSRLTTGLIFTSNFRVIDTHFLQTPAAYLLGKGIGQLFGQSISEPVKCAFCVTISSVFFKLMRDAAADRGFPITRWTWSQTGVLSVCVLVGIVISNLPRTFLTMWYKSLEKEKADLDKRLPEWKKTLNSQIEKAAQEGFDLTQYVADYQMHIFACAETSSTISFKKLSKEDLEKIESFFKKIDQDGYTFMKHFKEFGDLRQKNLDISPDLNRYKDLVAENTLSALFTL